MTAGRYVFRVRSYECGLDGRATMPAVCNYLQEAASLNAEALGFSKSDFDAAGGNISWVLTRLVVRMTRYPAWEEEVEVETYPRGGRRIVAWRDFKVRDSAGAVIGLATSEWMVIDLSTRKAVPVPAGVLELSGDPPPACVLGPEPFAGRIRFPEGEAREAWRFRAQNSQIDLNGHVNNVHYVEWLLEPLGGRQPAEIEVVFRSETMAGDEVAVEFVPGSSPGETLHRVFAPGGSDHAVARVRV